MQSKTDQNN